MPVRVLLWCIGPLTAARFRAMAATYRLSSIPYWRGQMGRARDGAAGERGKTSGKGMAPLRAQRGREGKDVDSAVGTRASDARIGCHREQRSSSVSQSTVWPRWRRAAAPPHERVEIEPADVGGARVDVLWQQQRREWLEDAGDALVCPALRQIEPLPDAARNAGG